MTVIFSDLDRFQNYFTSGKTVKFATKQYKKYKTFWATASHMANICGKFDNSSVSPPVPPVVHVYIQTHPCRAGRVSARWLNVNLDRP